MPNNIDTRNLDATAGAVFFAVGRGTEGGGSSYHLSIAGITRNLNEPQWGTVSAVRDNSGYSLGTIQVDFGQRGEWPLGATEERKLKPGETTYVDGVIGQASAYAKAVSLDPVKSGLLPVSYGQALMAVGTPDALKKAVGQISSGLERDRENAAGYRYLAQAYGELGEISKADLATAEGYYYGGAYQDAKIFALRAQRGLKQGEPGWVRAQDIINYRQTGKTK